jgi:hypothetical protein
MLLDLLNKQFEYGARGPNTFDCYGLLMEVYRRRGIILEDLISPDNKGLINAVVEEKKIDWIQIDKPEPFCAVTFKVKGLYSTHIGVILPDLNSFIHCIEKKQVAIEKLNHLLWKNRISGFYKYASDS